MKILPASLMGRTALVLVLALIVALTAAIAVFVGNRGEALSALGGRYAAERIATLVNLLEETAPENRRQVLRRLDAPGLRAGWGINPLVLDTEAPMGMARGVIRLLSKQMEGREIRAAIGPLPPPPEPESTVTAPPPPPPPPPSLPSPPRFGPGNFGMGHGLIGPALRVSVRLGDGTWLNVFSPIEPGESLWQARFVVPLLAALVAVAAAALIAVHRATSPLVGLAAAAERLGMDVNAPPLPERGPREVRAAAQAFNVMQGRIRRFVDDRTQMLAAISHDLRTPITRMRLRAEFVEDDEQRAKMLADLEEMEHMIASTLAFARDDATREERRPMDVARMVADMAEDLGVSYEGPPSLVVAARPLALKRAVANVLENARKYAPTVWARTERRDGALMIIVEDDGPGIAVGDRERVFAPFVRLESSRNRDTGGTGLGLAVARAALRAHGGDIVLTDAPQGGLRVTLSLPVS